MKRVELIQSNKKRKDELDKTVDKIISFYNNFCKELGIDGDDYNKTLPSEEEKKRGEEFFAKKTSSLQKEIKTYIGLGYSEEDALKRVLPKAYGLVRAASSFLWNKPHYAVQLKGGILLNDGYASQMATGEGKTLTATLPTYLNALLGKGAHVITPNEYLAKRDYEEMKTLYNLLGLSCGLVQERSPISSNQITAKTVSILGVELEKYTAGAKTEEEKNILIKKYMNDRKNAEQVANARKKAIEALQIEEALEIRKAYEADITYASSSAIAFDYLRDDITTDINKTVQRIGNPNFAVIDEVDAVLFDDAITPMTLSGKEEDSELAIKDEEIITKLDRIELANLAVARINTESGKLKQRSENEDILVGVISNDDEKYEAITRNETDSARYQDMTKAIIINQNTKEFFITTLGETMFYQYYRVEEVNKFLKEHFDEIINMKYGDEPLFREEYDYVINKYGRLEMEPRAFAHLVMSGAIPELTKSFEKFSTNDFINYRSEIDNAIRAWYILEKDVDYILTSTKNPNNSNEQAVSLVINGRTAKGRVYSDGLQQAIEKKIKYKTNIPIKETKMRNTLSSIPTASFFGRYSKFGGMTGTSAVTAFENLYGLETKEVERNRPKQVVDHGERMYASTEEKYAAIYEEVLKSHKKGQPVLLSTTSIEESHSLFKYLTTRLREEDSNFKVDTIKVLNANVALEQEAAVVAKAGMLGAITIATEMAGRGTDIKLGGEIPEVEELIPGIVEEEIAKIIDNLKNMGKYQEDKKEQVEALARKKVLSDMSRIEYKAELQRLAIQERSSKEKQQIKAAGGLKVIGSGHFAYSRVDDQVKGRCGRQGDPGEVIFFNDQYDLLKAGVDKTIVDRLQKQAELSPIIEDPSTNRTPIEDAVYEAQQKTERKVEQVIRMNNEIEGELFKYRRNFRKQKEMLKESNDYIDTAEYIIEETVKTVITSSSKNENPHLNDKTKLNNANLDIQELVELSNEFLGIELTPEEVKKFKTLGDLREYLTDQSIGIFRETIKSEGMDKVNEECKERINKMFKRVWAHFEEFVDTIKYQESLNRLAQYQGGMKIEHQIAVAYAHCVETQRGIIVRDLINPNYKEKLEKEPRKEMVAVRVTTSGVQRVTKNYDTEETKIVEEFVEEQQNVSISNLQPRLSRIFTLVNKVKLNRDPKEVGMNQKQAIDDEMEVVDFEETTTNTRKK